MGTALSRLLIESREVRVEDVDGRNDEIQSVMDSDMVLDSTGDSPKRWLSGVDPCGLNFSEF